MNDLYQYENELYDKGLKYIGGVDEVGRGPLIGPVVTACVVLPKDFKLEGLTDSKKLSEKKRESYYQYIIEHATSYATALCTPEEIDELNIYIPTTSIIKGDAKSISIAAASVVAKVTRDHMMYELDKEYPEYGFAKHKGYPTKKHIEAIHQYGLIDGYRKTYGPVKDVLHKQGI